MHRRAPLLLLPASQRSGSNAKAEQEDVALAFVRQLIDSRFVPLIAAGDLSDELPPARASGSAASTSASASAESKRERALRAFCPKLDRLVAKQRIAANLVSDTLQPAVERMARLFAGVKAANRDIWCVCVAVSAVLPPLSLSLNASLLVR